MDSIATTAASPAALASSQITEAYNWSGRQRAQFQADTDAAAKASGSDNVQLGFKDLLDLVNPLQHIPGISNVYQSVTGDDTMKPAVKTMGDIVYGGPIGGITSVFDEVFKQASGKDMTSTVAGWLGIGDDTVQTAAATTTQPKTAQTASAAGTAAASTPITLAAANTSMVQGLYTTGSAAVNSPAADAASKPPASGLFNSLQKGAAPQGRVLSNASQQKFFDPTSKQFTGITPATFKPSKDIANSNVSIGLEAKIQSNDITQSAVQSSNSVIASSAAQAAKTGTSTSSGQSDFAQKMLAAMDRYEATKKTGDTSAAPAVDTGL